MAMGDYANALAQYQKAVDANPDDPVGYDNLGHASGVSGDPDRAIAVLRKAIQVDPTYGLAYAHLAGVYYLRFNYEAAIENFQKAVDEGVRGEQYYYEFGLSYYNLNDCRNATIWLQKALEINPDSQANAGCAAIVREIAMCAIVCLFPRPRSQSSLCYLAIHISGPLGLQSRWSLPCKAVVFPLPC